jgi:hypothetical protein
VVIVDDVGAEEKHAAIVFPDLRETQYFGEEFSRTLEIFDLENQMADSFDFE